MRRSYLCFLFIMMAWSLSAKIQLPTLFTDNMVLQQQSDVPFWGKATPGKNVKITPSWDNKSYTVSADPNGDWKVKIQTPKAGGPYSITIADETKITLENILIGEVWICSGQSNMEMALAGWGRVNNYEQEIATANYPEIRLFQVEKKVNNQKLYDLKAEGGWKVCSPATAANFSAVAYFFGRNLNQNLHVPIGLIHTSWGGTIAEAWTSSESLEKMPDFKQATETIRNSYDTDEKKKYEQELAAWNAQVLSLDKGYQDKKPVWAATNFKDSDWPKMTLPGFWENEGLENFDGIVWFRKTIEIPKKWQGKDLLLSLGGIDDNDLTFVNGSVVGSSEGWNVFRNYTVPGKLTRKSQLVITVRVIDTQGNGGLYGEAHKMFIQLNTNERISLAGEWNYKETVKTDDKFKAPQSIVNSANRPTVIFNAMINPLIPFTIRGAIWYQGESNEGRAYQYRELFPLMIQDWRKQWNDNFPFYFVQLANFRETKPEPQESSWAELREAQFQTLHLENTGMAVSIDIGDAKDIHPKNKQDVGLRLALAARANTYGEKIVFSGPLYQSYQIENGKIRIRFTHAEGGLITRNNEVPKGFAIAGPDHKFYWANAVIDGNDILVSSPNVSFPVAVRYAWADNPECNLYNSVNLPASPFRTDDWPGVTFNKK